MANKDRCMETKPPKAVGSMAIEQARLYQPVVCSCAQGKSKGLEGMYGQSQLPPPK